MRTLLFGLCWLLLSGAQAAELPERDVFVMGAGRESCGTWTADHNDDIRHTVELHWVLGFIAGSNWRTDDKQAKFVDTNAVSSYIDNFCALNPLWPIAFAASAVVGEGGGPRPPQDFKR
jgi:hypothetical protein